MKKLTPKEFNELRAFRACALYPGGITPDEFQVAVNYRQGRQAKGGQLYSPSAARLTYLAHLGYLESERSAGNRRYKLTPLGITRLAEYEARALISDTESK